MRVTPGREGAKIRIDAGEAGMLATLLTELLAALEPDGLVAGDPVRERLFPDGYRDDPDAAAGFRDMTEVSLGSERTARTQRCLAEVRALGDAPAEVVLGDEAGERWLRVLTDLRLAIGTRLGVTEDTDFDDVAEEAEVGPGPVYLWLTAIQDALVRALMN